MKPRHRIHALTILVCGALLSACASRPAPSTAPAVAAGAPSPAATEENRPPPPAGQTRYKWSRATEADVAAQLDKKFEEAAKAYVQLKRGDQLMFCKKYKEMGSTIRTLHCITEAELRKQVEDSDELRANMRNRMGRCTGGQPVACSAGQ
jgi:hypothetical protein